MRKILAKASLDHSELGNQRWLFAAVALLAGVAAACQDGPNQTYSPPPANADWNDGRANPPDGGVPVVPNGTATSATAPFVNGDGGTIGSGGQNANEVCTQQQIAEIAPIIANSPIQLPNAVGNLNLAGAGPDGGVTWLGTTIEEAEQIDCQGTSEADIFGNVDYLSEVWGNGTVVGEYYIATQKLDYLGIGPGVGLEQYGVPMLFTSLDGSTSYSMPIDGVTPITATDTATGAMTTLNLDWVDASNGVPSAVAVFDTLYRAIMATFFPTYPVEPASQTCNQTGACIIGTFPSGAYAYFAINALEWAAWVNPYYDPVSANAINRMDFNFAQVMNYSPAFPVLNLSSAGPTTIPLQLNASGPACTLTLGGPNGPMTYSDFITNCVSTSTSSAANNEEELELFSDLSHDEETFQFNISGVDVSFADTRLGPTQTVVDPPQTQSGCVGDMANLMDQGCPEAPDTAIELNVDQSTLGIIANDWTFDSSNNPVLHDLHGYGALLDDYRTISMNNLEWEICSNLVVPPLPLPDAGTADAGPDAGASSGSGTAPLTPQQAQCQYWQNTSIPAQIAACLAPRDGSGALGGDPTQFFPTGCTGMESMLSSDITTVDDPVNVGPIVSQINPALTLGMKMGHQQGTWCADAMSRAEIAAQSYTVVCPGATGTCPAGQVCSNSSCPPPTSPPFTQLCPGGAGNCMLDGAYIATQTPFACAAGTCDPTQGTCNIGTPTCTMTVPTTATTPLTVAQVDLIGSVGIGAYLADPSGVAGGAPAPAGTEVVLALPYVCASENILPQSHVQAVNFLGGGLPSELCADGDLEPVGCTPGVFTGASVTALPIDIQDNRFWFKQYGFALIQTLEASNATGAVMGPVSSWNSIALGGTAQIPTLSSLMPVQINDLFFDSDGDGQFETMEYVDRRFVCPDGANNCAPPGATGFSCPGVDCTFGSAACAAGQPTCNAAETAQPPLDVQFGADVKDGIMNAYDFNRYMYHGETALYQMIQPAGYATAQASNALLSNTFGSSLINAFGGLPDGFIDITGVPINPNDYANATTSAPTPLQLSYGQQGSSPIVIAQTFPGAQQAQISYPNANSATGTSLGLLSWIPNQSGNGFNTALYGDSTLDNFVQSASIDFTGITTTALLDYNLIPTMAGPLGMEELASESGDFLGDVFMCYDPAIGLLAIRMYTPTLAVLNWLNQDPGSYALCGVVVRWSPYDDYINLIDGTLYGTRLQVTQGGGLGRIVGATVYVPGLPVEE